MGIKVAIVEDNADFRSTLENYINEAKGFSCTQACGSAEEALRILPRDLPDVVLMDLHLPNMSGVNCIRRLKILCPSAQILVLTVYEDSDSIFGALKAGASGYLLKRADPSDILSAIADGKQGGAPMSSEVACRVIRSFRETPADAMKIDKLSQTEEKVLQQFSKGYSTREVAERLSITINTVKTHLQHIYDKLHVRSRTEAVLKFIHKHPGA
jgi:DNA-binding NarL/FixJ family response regulator